MERVFAKLYEEYLSKTKSWLSGIEVNKGCVGKVLTIAMQKCFMEMGYPEARSDCVV